MNSDNNIYSLTLSLPWQKPQKWWINRAVRYLIIYLIICYAYPAYAQQNLNIDINPRFGTLIERPSTGEKILFDTYSYGFQAAISKQLSDNEYWKTYFGNPVLGLRYSYNYYDNDIYGDSHSIFPFIEGKLVSIQNISLNYVVGFGLSYHTKVYDRISNPLNNYISFPLTTIIDLSIQANQKLSDKLSLMYGVNFAHFSNGAIKTPNKGINQPTIYAGLRYTPSEVTIKYEKKRIEKPEIGDKNEFYFFLAPGVTERRFAADKENKMYFGGSVELGYKRLFHPCFKWGAGIDITYTSYEKFYLDPWNPPSDWHNVSVMIFAAYEIIFGDVFINVALGFHPIYSAKPAGIIGERVGIFYNLGKHKNNFAGISIKAAAGKADWIEWTWGHRFRF